jgi:coproporphyrinogen III oxidase-like Fe-S oxidoreductase
MRIEINKENIQEYAKRYDERSKGTQDEIIYNEMINWLKCNRFLDKEKFLKIWDWKNPDKRQFKKTKEINEDERIKKNKKCFFPQN